MEYRELIPPTPEGELIRYLKEEVGMFSEHTVTFKAIGYADAEAAMDEYDCRGDFRENTHRRPARCWCSGCESVFLAEYIPAKTCGGKGISAGIRMEDIYVPGVQQEHAEGASIVCPCCQEVGVLRGAAFMRFGKTEQHFVARAYVAGCCLVIVKYMVEENIWKEKVGYSVKPFEAFVIDGKKAVKLRLWQRGMGGYFKLEGWTQNKRFEDTLVSPVFYTWNLPDLAGTSLENAKLWEYMEQTYEQGTFYPVAYARLYLKHQNVENLVTSGLGSLVGDGIRREECSSGRYYYVRSYLSQPRLSWVNWKEARPSKMLGLTKDEMRFIRDKGWDLDKLEAFKEAVSKISITEAEEAMEVMQAGDLKNLAASDEWTGKRIMQAVRYLEKTKNTITTLKDYWRMATLQGLDLDNPVVRWPRDLRAAHDRVMEAQKYTNTPAQREAFQRMSERCRGLNWSNGAICIRVAETPEELVKEGETLHHCVGGYTEDHAKGKIILFIRHARRPERSWFTLNLDVIDKKIIQNHGYGNERSPKGVKLHIPKEVLQFVEEWKRQVLAFWKLPATANKEKNRRTGKKKAAA